MTIVIRPSEGDDADWIVKRHAQIYAAEFGFNEKFGQSIQRKMDEFLAKPDTKKQIWIAERSGERLGSIALSARGPGTGFINFFLVLPEARGQQLGQNLVKTALGVANDRGFCKLELVTYSCLTSARRVYCAFGFELLQTDPDQHLFGQVIDHEIWRLSLSSWQKYSGGPRG